MRANYLPDDRLRESDRWGYALRHTGVVGSSLLPGGAGLSLNLNRVSDDNYWSDFSRQSASLTAAPAGQ